MPFYVPEPPQIDEFRIYPTSTFEETENYIITMKIWIYNPSKDKIRSSAISDINRLVRMCFNLSLIHI